MLIHEVGIMHGLEISAWTARLGHLLVTERYGFCEVRFPGDVPIAARSRTARHLARKGPEAITAICEAWPGATTLPIWPDLNRTWIEQPNLGPPPAPMARRGFVEFPSSTGEPPSLLNRLLQQLAYLYDEEEFQGPAFELLTLSDAWRALLHDVADPCEGLLDAYLDTPSPTVRRIVRLALRKLGLVETDRVLPLLRVPSGHFDVQGVQAPALITMSPVLALDGSAAMPRRRTPDRGDDWSPAECGEVAGC
jgi:hypothetical protein